MSASLSSGCGQCGVVRSCECECEMAARGAPGPAAAQTVKAFVRALADGSCGTDVALPDEELGVDDARRVARALEVRGEAKSYTTRARLACAAGSWR